MILKKIYDEKTKTQRIWHDSTMIAYTEMVEDECENKGDLYVTFRNGSTYIYKDVIFEDYILFIGGGTDASQGKTLNKIIKTKYDFEKGEQKNVQKLFEELKEIEEHETLKNKNITHTFRIIGEEYLDNNEIEFNYYPRINQILHMYPDAQFIIGGNNLFDKHIQDYFMDILGVNPEIIEIYYVGEKPNYINSKIINKHGDFKTLEDQNTAMINLSIDDIAFIRSTEENTNTSNNILKRYLLK